MLVKPLLNEPGIFSAIPNSSRLKHVVERRVARNSLGFDAQGARGDQIDSRLPEGAARARVVDFGMPLLVADDVPRAIRTQMLVLGEDDRIGNADGSPRSISPTDFPEAADSLIEDRRTNGSRQGEEQ